uniref:Uncharacterized protein n=1 Tax=Salix viminalis TaxID=40686 RepID=A0A6N2LUL1_SALVM
MEHIKCSSSSILYYNQPKNGSSPFLALTPHSFLTRSNIPHYPRRKKRLTYPSSPTGFPLNHQRSNPQ